MSTTIFFRHHEPNIFLRIHSHTLDVPKEEFAKFPLKEINAVIFDEFFATSCEKCTYVPYEISLEVNLAFKSLS